MNKSSLTISVKIFFFVLIVVLIIAILILSSVPPVSRDALSHHLFVPNMYLKHGGIFEIPSIPFSYYPMNLDLLYVIPLYFGNDIVPKYIHFAFALLAALFIFRYLKRRIDSVFALFGVLFFLSIPVIIKLSITVYVDLGLIFFSTASVLYLLKWVEDFSGIKYLAVSGIFAGLAVGTKYNGLILLALLTLFVPYLYSRGAPQRNENPNKGIVYGAVFLIIALLVFSPWVIRNYVWTGNPLYPLYNCFFNSVDCNSDRSAGHLIIRKTVFNETWWETATVPVRIFFQGRDNSAQYFDGKLNPFLFILPFFAFYRIRQDSLEFKTEKKVLLVFSIAYLFIVFFKGPMRIRWAASIIPSLVILSMYGLYNIKKIVEGFKPGFLKKALGIGACGIPILMTGMNIHYLTGQLRYVDPFSYLSGAISRDSYIERFRPEYSVMKYANETVPGNARILGVFLGGRGYYSDRDITFEENIFFKALKTAGSPEMITRVLEKENITHIIMRHDILTNWVNNNLDSEKKGMLKKFFQENITLLEFKNGYGLYLIDKKAI